MEYFSLCDNQHNIISAHTKIFPIFTCVFISLFYSRKRMLHILRSVYDMYLAPLCLLPFGKDPIQDIRYNHLDI